MMWRILLQFAEAVLACLLGIVGGLAWILYSLWVVVTSLLEDMT